ncbi:MAG: asparagine synthase (glutamine-hydrolyzing) [Phycisphaerales bacterium]|nr:asparagine synthase (glutamine-hydrolyzing) [Phycisphaerales bacterium]MCB9854908.1 asparagine synthase (glutamine-hydrolyzing) [Phycisphaerales bacterium]MCB9864411.1 asparagine synthase (glutamine-hydrolyzing) [Phycisphaerales bacterium]
MCGIAGILNAHRDDAVRAGVLDRMVDALTHRGPDDRGTFVDQNIGIGMRRLSIIDVAGGHQPMSGANGDVQIVYNGECYNHADLRKELAAAGHQFRTTCDTEVVLCGYLEWGIEELCKRLNGIYAFSIWDARKNRAYVVRDRLGVKPLYYVHRNRSFAFSSELRSLTHSALLQPRICETALWGYLAYQFTPDDQTLLAGAKKLLPGHYLEWHAGSISTHKYWTFPQQGEDASANLKERTEALRLLLWDIVERQMMSDVPIGCFLSGGLDSTIIACMMAKLADQPLRTFSIAFPGQADCDESNYFEDIAKGLGAKHQTIDFSDREVLDHLDEFAWAMDEPVADPAMLPTYLLSREASKQVKVVLTGEGADEVFAGYPYYRPFVMGRAPVHPMAIADQKRQWLNFSEQLSWRMGGAFFCGPRNNELSPISNFPYSMDSNFLWNLIHPDRRPPIDRAPQIVADIEARAMADMPTDASPLQRALALDTRLWLANDLMPKLDKMTMAHSLEGRVPFLDHRLVEMAFTLPGRFKVGAEHGKLILRDAVRDIIPTHMVNRVKHGFNVPLYQWFKGPLHGFARDTLLGGPLESLGLLDRRSVESLIVAHTEMDMNMARPLWQLICLTRWFDLLQRDMTTQARAHSDKPMEFATRDSLNANSAPASLWARVPEPEGTERDVCDIVMPIYDGVNYVRDAVRSILKNTDYPFRLILVDDSANDATYAALEEIEATDDRIELHRNEENLGFVQTANRGMALADAEYVCLINSDIMVAEGWLDAMIRCAQSDPAIAVVNPLSNMCVNLSVPMPPGYNMNTMAEQVAARSRRAYPALTTAVGFCMLVKRRYLNFFGGFDEIYGRGYCEESDFCMRLTEEGLRVVAADDAFVYHKGCGSFGTWIDRYLKNRKIFDARWEDAYLRDYHHFLKRNPLQYMRDALLRNTILETEWTRPAARALDRMDGVRRFESFRLPAQAVATNGSPTGEQFARNVVRQFHMRPRTLLDPTQRRVRYPTRSYLDRLPKSDRMRITFLIADSMPVCGGIISVSQLAREMVLEGHDVRLATVCRELEPERFNLPVQPLVYKDREELIRLFPESDVVIATFWTTAYDYIPSLRARYDFVSVYFVQDYEVYFYPEDDFVNRRKAAATYTMTDYRIVKSQWLKRLIEREHGASCDQIHLGLDLGIFRNRKSGDALGDPPRVMSVARPGVARRGFDEAVDAFRRVHAARPDVQFVFFGTEDEMMPKDLGFPYVNAGRLDDQNKVAQLIGSCDVLVDSSLFQGFGRPGLEAMACGTACVLTSEGGVNEYARDGENCLMVRPRDNAGMAQQILHLLDDHADRNRLRRSGLETAKSYCHVDEAQLHLEKYDEWIDRRIARSRAALASASVVHHAAP